jgi:hypothetical protein
MIGGYHTAIYAFIMEISNPIIAATQYSFITNIFNVLEWTGATLGDSFISLLVYSCTFCIKAGFLI